MTLERFAELARTTTGWSALIAALLFAYAGARVAMDVRGTRPAVAPPVVSEEDATLEVVPPATPSDDPGSIEFTQEEADAVDGGRERSAAAPGARDAGADAGPLLAESVVPVRVHVRVPATRGSAARVTIDGLEAGGVPFDADVECFRGDVVIVQVSAPGFRSRVERLRCREGARFEVGSSLSPWN